MRRLVVATALAAGMLAAPPVVSAQTLLSTDFQNGSSAPWQAQGGGVSLSTYSTNVSLRLLGHASAVASVQPNGVAAVTIQAAFAGFGLGPRDTCVAEYSTDGAATWKPVVVLEPYEADGLTMHAGHAAHVDVSHTAALELRLRADLSREAGACWGDNITVVAERPAVVEDASAPRSQLLLADLNGGVAKGPVRMLALTRPPAASAPTQRFQGRLVLDAAQLAGGFEVLRNQPYDITVDAAMRSLPPFDFAFVQDGDAIIPVQRGPIASPHPDWEWVLEPGTAWDESGDQGLSRASLPFSLQERNSNCLHNGVLSFAFRADGTISDVYFQISSETCAYLKFDAWGVVKARYQPGPVDGAATVAAAYRQEVAARLPVRPLAELLKAHPELSADGFALATPPDGDLPTLYGVVIDGVNYAGGCDTRAGPYPYCDVLDLPSYSTAKTIVGAIGLMRLEKLWPGARDALIADYVPECATADWKGVTFENALDMMTGVYNSDGFEADENNDDTIPFFWTDGHAARIAFACGHYHRKAPPGAQWVYHTSDTYILGTAMQEFVRRRLGRGADFYDALLAQPLWAPEHLSPLMITTRRTYDSVRQPFTGFGLTYHRDDVVRIARLLAVDDGKVGGEEMLDPAMLRRALQRDPQHRGPTAGYPGYDYIDGVWGRELAAVLHCKSPAWTPFMSGFGGNSVVMLRGGVIYYYFGDSEMWDWTPAAVEINKIRLICR